MYSVAGEQDFLYSMSVTSKVDQSQLMIFCIGHWTVNLNTNCGNCRAAKFQKNVGVRLAGTHARARENVYVSVFAAFS